MHEIACSIVKRETHGEYSVPTGDTYAEVLRAYAHGCRNQARYEPDLDLNPDRRIFRWTAMTAEEACAWMRERTGPMGGENFKGCHRCAPTP